MANKSFLNSDQRAQPLKVNKRIQQIRKDEELNSVLSKMVHPHDAVGQQRSYAGQGMSNAFFRQVSDIASRNVTDSHMIFQLLPDMELAMQIMVSSIISPKDLVSVDINYSVMEGSMDSELSGELLKVISDYFDKTYKIKKMLPECLEAALFKRGSYPTVILSENAIDRLINAQSMSTESLIPEIEKSFTRDGIAIHKGILGPSTTGGNGMSLESMFSSATTQGVNYQSRVNYSGKKECDMLVSVTDNPDALKMPALMDKASAQRITDAYSLGKFKVSTESTKINENRNNDELISAAAYPSRNYSASPVMRAMTPSEFNDDEENQGHPIVMTPPSESMIPVFVPGTPSQHVGYFLVLDQTGNPISTANREDYYSQLTDNLSNESEITNTLREVQASMHGERSNDQMRVEEATRLYTQIVEEDLLARLRNGVYGSEVSISRPDEIYRVMLARALSGRRTQLLYIPQDSVTYFAYDYNEVGLGVSLLEKTKILAVMRILMLFANTTAGIKNSITNTQVDIQLSEKDPNPQKTVEMFADQVMALRGNDFPVRTVNMQDMRDYFTRAGLSFNVQGNPRYPEMSVNLNEQTANKAPVDRDYEESLRDRHIQGIGLAPEILDMFKNADFATSIVSSNLLLSKTVQTYQDTTMWFMHDFITKYSMASGPLMDKLAAVVSKNMSKIPKRVKKDSTDVGSKIARTLEIFFENLMVKLPEPDHAALENQIEALDIYIRGLDSALEAYISRDILDREAMPEGMSDLSDHLVQAVRGYFIRQWLRSNGAYNELDRLVERDDDGNFLWEVLEECSDYLGDMKDQMFEYTKAVLESRKKFGDKFQKVQDKLDAEEEEETPPAAGSGEGPVGDDTGGEEPGGDEPPVDDTVDDVGGDEPPAEEEGDEPEPPEEEDDTPPGDDDSGGTFNY